MINFFINLRHEGKDTPSILKSCAGKLRLFPSTFWMLNLRKTNDWGFELAISSRFSFIIAGFGHGAEFEIYKKNRESNGYEDYVRMLPIPSSSRPPLSYELEPKLNYCWWWNSHEYAWEYADCRHCDLSIYTYFMDWRAIPYPGVEYVG